MAVDFEGFERLQKRLKRLEKESGDICEAVVREIGGRFLSLVIRETPLGQRPEGLSPAAAKLWEGYVGGTLKRGWIARTGKEAENGTGEPSAAEINSYKKSVAVAKNGKTYTLTLMNTVKYAPYVEYGHRQNKGAYIPRLGKRLVTGWAPGRFFLRRTVTKLRPALPAIIEKKFNTEIKKRFNNG